MTVSLHGHDGLWVTEFEEVSSSESRRQEVTEQTWYAAEDCSRSVQRRLEKLGRRRLRVGYWEQTVHETKRNADAFESKLRLCWMVKFASEVWRCQTMKTWSESRRQEVTEQMWYAAEDCSRSVQRRLGKLGRRRLRVGYGGQTVHETKRNADAFESKLQLCWMVKFASEVWRCQPMKTSVSHNGQIVIYPPWNFQPV